ncbi:MAG: phosphatidate cytidylyltransferase [Acidimicrobiia bacterium]|nr:phosphatidate cytidylyltransferase [Acidimicrobiia bacterium]
MDDRPRDEQTDEPRERRGPRPSSESVRIIGADEAAAAIEAGQAAGRRPDDAPRFGDVPAAPEGPRPPLRFPMPGADPSSVAKPPIVGTPASPEDLEDEAYLEGLTPTPPDDPEGWAAEPESWSADEPESWAPDEPEAWTDEEDDWGVEPEPPAPSRPTTDSPTLVTPARGVELPHWTEPGTGEVPAILGEPEPGANEPDEEEELAWSAFSAAPRWRDQPSDWEEPDFDAAAALADDETRVGALDTGQTDYSDLYSFDEPEPAPPPVQEPVAPTIPPPMPPREPTTYEPVAEVAGPPAERDLPVAIGAGLLLGVAVLIAAKVGAVAVLILITGVLVVAAFELYETLRTRGYHPATLLGLVGTASMLGAVYWKGEDAMPLVLSLFVVFTFLWYLAGVVHARPAMNVAITVMAFMYVGFLGSFAALLLRIPGVTAKGGLGHDGITLFLLPVIATVAYDVGAYAVGGRTGRTPLAPNVSPNKTWEGLVGATVITFIVTLLVVAIFKMHPWTISRAFWLAAVVCVAAPLGDLCESMVKRDLGVKDMGRVLPGHGGVLDRVDGLLFVAPAAYYLLRLLKFA